VAARRPDRHAGAPRRPRSGDRLADEPGLGGGSDRRARRGSVTDASLPRAAQDARRPQVHFRRAPRSHARDAATDAPDTPTDLGLRPGLALTALWRASPPPKT